MSTEPVVAPPVAEAEKTATDDAQKPEVATPEAEQTPEQPADTADKSLERMNRRIAKRTADYYREKARADELEAKLSQPKAGESEPKDQAIDPQVLAKEIARATTYAEKANAIVEVGSKENKDFLDKLRDLATEVGPFVQTNGLPTKFMEAVLEVSDKPHALLYHLGQNPDLAEDLANLSPYKLAQKLDRIEQELNAKPKQSAAPKPLVPDRGTANNSLRLGELEGDDFDKRRREMIAKRR